MATIEFSVLKDFSEKSVFEKFALYASGERFSGYIFHDGTKVIIFPNREQQYTWLEFDKDDILDLSISEKNRDDNERFGTILVKKDAVYRVVQLNKVEPTEDITGTSQSRLSHAESLFVQRIREKVKQAKVSPYGQDLSGRDVNPCQSYCSEPGCVQCTWCVTCGPDCSSCIIYVP